MKYIHDNSADDALILAAEECPPDRFSSIHSFSTYDENVIRKLTAHGPVLIRGGRGSGKSALLLEAHHRTKNMQEVFSVYISLRYLPLLQSEGDQYIGHFCTLLAQKIQEEITERHINFSFEKTDNQASLQMELVRLAQFQAQRIVLLFDDAAHIGREKPLEVFFDLFRTLSTSIISCKASIYPGVTRFGVRFDVYNDATVIDINRLDSSISGSNFFLDVLSARYPKLSSSDAFSDRLSPKDFANFIGRAVVGNMRGFVLACSRFESSERIGIPQINACILNMALDYYWPLMEEVAPKLGIYEPMVEPAQRVMEAVVEVACRPTRQTDRHSAAAIDRVLIHRQLAADYAKVFEILEYLGFISRREASRALKSGGRGPVYAINLCNLLDQMPQQRLTQDIFREWLSGTTEAAEIHVSGNTFSAIKMPPISDDHGLTIFNSDISKLSQSKAYPYGLTEDKVERLKSAGIQTIGALAATSDSDLLKLERVGDATVRRIRNVLYQAIWM